MRRDSIVSDIFLSYNHEDLVRARAFADALTSQGFSVWWDVGLRTGEAYDEVTETALRSAKAVIVLWSVKSAVSRWVRAEATLALRNKSLFPCMIEPCDRPIMFELTQTADLTRWQGDCEDPAWIAFVADLKRFIDGGASALATDKALTSHAVIPSSDSRHGAGGRLAIDRRTALVAGGAAAVGALAFGIFRRRAGKLVENGVAVLPFRNLSGDPAQDYLSAGLSSEVRSVLARNVALRVVAQASCEAIKQRAIGAAEMARELAVSFLLDGNVRLADDRLHVAAELIDGRTGFSRWSHQFARPMNELSTLQNVIADAVTAELAIDPSSAPSAGGYGSTKNAAAFNDYLKGNELYSAATDLETDLAALARFDRAIERDPNFGAAYAARARSLTSLGNTSNDVDKAREYYESAQFAARRAVEAGPSSADAHSTLGYVLFQAQLHVAEARAPYERSYELGGGEAAVLGRFAGYEAATRRFTEAEHAVKRARELDPLNATIHRAVGFVQYASGDYQASIESVKQALSLNNSLSDSYARIGMAHIALDQPQEALEAAAREKSDMVRFPCIAIAQHMLDDDAAAQSAMTELKVAFGDAGLYQQAQILSRWGEEAEALAVLRRAKEMGDSGLTYAFIDPTLHPLREHPDFKQLVKDLGFV